MDTIDEIKFFDAIDYGKHGKAGYYENTKYEFVIFYNTSGTSVKVFRKKNFEEIYHKAYDAKNSNISIVDYLNNIQKEIENRIKI